MRWPSFRPRRRSLPGRRHPATHWRALRLETLEDRLLLSTVTNLGDSGAGSLREALAITPANQQIDFAPGLSGTIVLTSGPLNVTKNVNIVGPGAGVLAVSGNGASTVFGIGSASVAVAIHNLTIRDGAAAFQGGGVLNFGTLYLTNVSILNSTAISGGGGIYNGGSLTLTNCFVAGNVAGTAINAGSGGGLMNTGLLTIVNSSIVTNAAIASGNGGGIANFHIATISNTLIGYNSASNLGGGIYTNGALTVSHATLAANSATTGGGLAIDAGASPAQLTNTIVASNSATNARDVWGAFALATHNLIGVGDGSSGLVHGVSGNLVGTAATPIDPVLGALQSNGGPTPSVSLLPGSPAIDAGANSGAASNDQRGFSRIVNAVTDIGAYEYQPPATVTVVTTSANPSDENQPLTIYAPVTGVASGSNMPFGFVTIYSDGISLGDYELANGAATMTTSTLPPGTRILTADFHDSAVGDAVWNSSASAAFQQVVRAATVTALQVSPGTASVHDVVTLTATVTGPNNTPTGTIVFRYGAITIGTANLVGGTAVWQTAAIPGGTHAITATYGGDALFAPSVSPGSTLIIQPINSSTGFTVGPNPSVVNQAIVLTATVSPAVAGSIVPTGTVTFFDGNTPIGTKPLSGNVATLTVASLAAGTHSLSARYNGDNSFFTSTSPSVNQGIIKTTTTTLVTGNVNLSIVGTPVVFTATISPSPSGPVQPSGTVSFFDGAALLGVATVNSGIASLVVSSLTVGDHAITAVYSGDGNFDAGAPGAVSHTVKPYAFFAVGGAPGRVRFLLPDNTLVADFQPFGGGVDAAIAVATGDINGDGYYDLVTAPTAGNPHVKVYDGKAFATGGFNSANPDATLLAQWFPFALQFNVGSNLSVGDVNNDGFADVITGATAGNPHVKVHNGLAIANGTFHPESSLLASFFPYALQFNVGAYVAAGDVDGDGFADVVTGASVGNPHVKVYAGQTIAAGSFNNDKPDASLIGQVFPFAIQFNVGAAIAVADVDGDGKADVITGASVGNPHVRTYGGASIAAGSPAILGEFFAYGLNFNVGVRVGAADFDGDGHAEILTGASVGSPHYRVVKASATGVVPDPILEGIPNGFSGGIFVAA